jgi:hypothetical protein
MKRCVDCSKYYQQGCTVDPAELDDKDCLDKFLVSELHQLNERLSELEVFDGNTGKI